MALKINNLSAIAFLTVSLVATSRASEVQPQAEVLHWWATEGESAALSVFIDEFERRGGLNYNSVNSDEVANRAEAIERMGKGYPATLTQWNAGKDLSVLYEFGLLKAIDSPDIIDKLENQFPAQVLDAVSYRGNILAMPLNIHSENWMWYSHNLLDESDVDLQGDWSPFLEKGKMLAEKNIPLLAVGNEQWQVRILFTSVFLGVSRERYRDFYIKNAVDVVDTEDFRATLKIFSELASYSKSFGDGHWNTQVGAVAANRAAAVSMGDWARSEFMALGQRVGDDYGCQLTSSQDPSLLMVIDTFILGNVEEESEIAGQELMLDVVSDPETSLKFNALKGSVSPYAQPEATDLDACTSQVYAALQDNDAVISPYQSYLRDKGAFSESIDRAILDFWIASGQVDQESDDLIVDTVETFRDILKSIEDYPYTDNRLISPLGANG